MAPGQLIVDTGKAAMIIVKNTPTTVQSDAQAKDNIENATVDHVLNTTNLISMTSGALTSKGEVNGLMIVGKQMIEGARQMVTTTGHVVIVVSKRLLLSLK